jgi:hypothetical protein
MRAGGGGGMAIAGWWRRLWQPTGWGPPPAVDRTKLDQLIGRAEAAYDRMYDAHRPKDDYDDARAALGQAIDEATRLKLDDEVARLSARLKNIEGVYNSQFRGV